MSRIDRWYLGDFRWNGEWASPKYQYIVDKNSTTGEVIAVWREVTVNRDKRHVEIKLADAPRHAQITLKRMTDYLHLERQIPTLNQLRIGQE